MFPLLKDFFTATPTGTVTIPWLLNLPCSLVVLAVILMAVGGFAGATWVERTMAAHKGVA